MWDIIGTLIAIGASLMFLSSAYIAGDRLNVRRERDCYAQQLALEWTTFGEALQRYVQDKVKSLPKGDTEVSCDALKKDGYLSASFNCTDRLGEQLSGLVSKPIGVLQSVVVYPESPPTEEILKRLRVNEGIGEKSFIFKVNEDVKKLYSNWEMVAYRDSGDFDEALEKNTDNIKDYIAGDTVPAKFLSGYPYVPLLFIKRAKGVGYWVWSFDGGDRKTIQFHDEGFSSVCPDPRGLPKDPPNPEWKFGFWDANYRMFCHTIPDFYICIPATKSTVLKNPDASIPPITLVPPDDWAKDNFLYKKDPITGWELTWVCQSCGLSGKTNIGMIEIHIGERTYTFFITKSIDASGIEPDGTSRRCMVIFSPAFFVKGSAPDTFCWDFSHWGQYNYCFNLKQLLTSAGGSVQTVTFKE